MCEANVYLIKDGEEELLMEEVDIIRPEEGKYYLRSVFGEQKVVDAKIKSISLVNHKIILEEAE
jgi:predicted RNA-binding protein